MRGCAGSILVQGPDTRFRHLLRFGFYVRAQLFASTRGGDCMARSIGWGRDHRNAWRVKLIDNCRRLFLLSFRSSRKSEWLLFLIGSICVTRECWLSTVSFYCLAMLNGIDIKTLWYKWINFESFYLGVFLFSGMFFVWFFNFSIIIPDVRFKYLLP